MLYPIYRDESITIFSADVLRNAGNGFYRVVVSDRQAYFETAAAAFCTGNINFTIMILDNMFHNG